MGTAAPALDFAPLVRELDTYNVIVIEGFGYGYADRSGPPRTVENITAELHEVLSKLGIEKPYVLAGHSIAGFYTLSYVNRYPGEVSAVVAIDPTVPAAKAGDTGPVDGGFNWRRLVQVTGRVLQVSGVVRVAIAIVPALVEEPTGDAYSETERAQMHWTQSPAMAEKITNFLGQN